MNIEEVKNLIELFEKSSLSELKYKTDKDEIRLKKSSGNETNFQPFPIYTGMPAFPQTPENNTAVQPPASAPVPQKIDGTWVKAPFVGVFYTSPSENSAPFVTVGQKVSKGDTLCILEAMKVMNEIKAPVDGTIKEIKAENGKLVEYDEEMILIGE